MKKIIVTLVLLLAMLPVMAQRGGDSGSADPSQQLPDCPVPIGPCPQQNYHCVDTVGQIGDVGGILRCQNGIWAEIGGTGGADNPCTGAKELWLGDDTCVPATIWHDCLTGNYIQSINWDGTVECAPDLQSEPGFCEDAPGTPCAVDGDCTTGVCILGGIVFSGTPPTVVDTIPVWDSADGGSLDKTAIKIDPTTGDFQPITTHNTAYLNMTAGTTGSGTSGDPWIGWSFTEDTKYIVPKGVYDVPGTGAINVPSNVEVACEEGAVFEWPDSRSAQESAFYITGTATPLEDRENVWFHGCSFQPGRTVDPVNGHADGGGGWFRIGTAGFQRVQRNINITDNTFGTCIVHTNSDCNHIQVLSTTEQLTISRNEVDYSNAFVNVPLKTTGAAVAGYINTDWSFTENNMNYSAASGPSLARWFAVFNLHQTVTGDGQFNTFNNLDVSHNTMSGFGAGLFWIRAQGTNISCSHNQSHARRADYMCSMVHDTLLPLYPYENVDFSHNQCSALDNGVGVDEVCGVSVSGAKSATIIGNNLATEGNPTISISNSGSAVVHGNVAVASGGPSSAIVVTNVLDLIVADNQLSSNFATQNGLIHIVDPGTPGLDADPINAVIRGNSLVVTAGSTMGAIVIEEDSPTVHNLSFESNRIDRSAEPTLPLFGGSGAGDHHRNINTYEPMTRDQFNIGVVTMNTSIAGATDILKPNDAYPFVFGSTAPIDKNIAVYMEDGELHWTNQDVYLDELRTPAISFERDTVPAVPPLMSLNLYDSHQDPGSVDEGETEEWVYSFPAGIGAAAGEANTTWTVGVPEVTALLYVNQGPGDRDCTNTTLEFEYSIDTGTNYILFATEQNSIDSPADAGDPSIYTTYISNLTIPAAQVSANYRIKISAINTSVGSNDGRCDFRIASVAWSDGRRTWVFDKDNQGKACVGVEEDSADSDQPKTYADHDCSGFKDAGEGYLGEGGGGGTGDALRLSGQSFDYVSKDVVDAGTIKLNPDDSQDDSTTQTLITSLALTAPALVSFCDPILGTGGGAEDDCRIQLVSYDSSTGLEKTPACASDNTTPWLGYDRCTTADCGAGANTALFTSCSGSPSSIVPLGGGGGGATNFLNLTDTGNYTVSTDGYAVIVNNAGAAGEKLTYADMLDQVEWDAIKLADLWTITDQTAFFPNSQLFASVADLNTRMGSTLVDFGLADSNPTIFGVAPALNFTETDAGVDRGKWKIEAQGSELEIQTCNDADACFNMMRFTGTATFGDKIEFGSSIELLVEDGSVAAPPYAFLGNPGSGFYIDAGGLMRASKNGVDQGQMAIFAGPFAATSGALVPDPGTESNQFLRDDGTWQTITSGGGATGPWNADNFTGVTPVSGKFAMDATLWNNVTSIEMHDVNADGVDSKLYLRQYGPGDIIYLQEQIDSGVAAIYLILTATENALTFTYTVDGTNCFTNENCQGVPQIGGGQGNTYTISLSQADPGASSVNTFAENFSLFDVDGLAAKRFNRVWKVPAGEDCTVTRIECNSNVADMDINVQTEGGPGLVLTDSCTCESPMTATPAACTPTAITANLDLSAGDYIYLEILDPGATPATELAVQFHCAR